MSTSNDYAGLTREQLRERLLRLESVDKALQGSEAYLSSVLRAAPVGIGVLKERVILEVNDAMTIMTGYGHDELIGKPARMLYERAADYDYVGTEKYRLMREYGVGRVESRWRRKDGTVIDVYLSSTPIVHGDYSGRIVFSAEDITERKRAEEALRQKEDLYRCTLQTLPAHIAVIGRDGRIVEVNKAWSDFARSNDADDSPQVAVGADYLAIVRRAADMDDPYAVSAVAGLEAVLNGALPQFSMEYPCHGPNEQRWFLMTALPLSTKAGGGLVITHLNISERRQMEDALRESEERYRLLVSTSFDAVLLTSPDGRTLFANEAAGRMFGCSPEEVCRRGRDGVVDMTDARVAQFVAERARNGHVHGELTFVRADGEKFPGELSSVLFRDRNGELRSSMVIRDISERKQVEAERLAAMERQRDTLVREVHHRIKNHLQGVSGMLRGMANSYPESARPLEAAIAQVRAIAQVYGLQSAREDARVRLCDLVRTSAENMIGPVPVVCHLPPAGTEAILSQEEAVPLALVVNELLTNAIKHIGLADPQWPVIVSLDIWEGHAVMQISNGPARLPPEFDFIKQRGISTGLELVAALLPPKGASLVISQEGDDVVAELVLEAPAIWEFVQSA